ncbi:hypothetical protein QEN19_001660 [Hanseniaspora menglaensis]
MRTRRRSSSQRNQAHEIKTEDSEKSRKQSKNVDVDTKSIKINDVLNIINVESTKLNKQRLKNNLLGQWNDYYNLHYKFDDPNDGNSYFNSLDLYSVKSHQFVNENLNIIHDYSFINLKAEFLFNINEFDNSLYQNSIGNSTKRISERRRKSNTFNKREMIKYYKLANQKKKSNDAIITSDEDEDDVENNEELVASSEIFDSYDDIEVSDDEEEDSETKNVQEEGIYCEGIVLLENKFIQLIGIATKNGYLNFKIIDKRNIDNRDGISVFLNYPIKDIKFATCDHEMYMGTVNCTLTTGDLFFLAFEFDNTKKTLLKDMMKYKYCLLRKSSFQESKFIDFKIIDTIITAGKIVYNFVVLDRYGNYTNGSIINSIQMDNLKVALDTSKTDNCSFKGSLFDVFNMELPYKRILSGPNSDTLYLIDNTKVLSVNKKLKTTLLITHHKFWSKVIACFDMPQLAILFTNMELIITKKLHDKLGNAVLERIVSVKHYFKLLNYNSVSLQAHLDELNSVLIVFIKPLNILYFFSINSETGDIYLINNLPVSCIITGLSEKNKKFIYLVGQSLYFITEVDRKESIQRVDLIKNKIFEYNLKIVNQISIESDSINENTNDVLITEHEDEVKFENEYNEKAKLNLVVAKFKNKKVIAHSNADVEKQVELLESFGNRFYEVLQNKYVGSQVFGSISMNEIMSVPVEIENLSCFKDFNEQLCQSINKNSPFKVITIYDADQESIEKIWRNQLILVNVDNMNCKEEFLKKIRTRFTDDSFALLKNGISNWNPGKFKSFENCEIQKASEQPNKSFSSYSQKKKMSLQDFFPEENKMSSQLVNEGSQLYSQFQNSISSPFNDSSIIGSTQKYSQEEKIESEYSTKVVENESKSRKIKKSSSHKPMKKVKKVKKGKTVGGTSGFF